MASARGGRRRSHHRQRPRRRMSQRRRAPGGGRRRGGRGARGRCFSQPVDSRTLQQIRRDSKFLSSKAKQLMIHFVDDLYARVSREAERLRKESRRPTISPEHMEAALRHVMPKRWRRQVPSAGSRSWH